MKNVLLLVLFLGLIFTGCSDLGNNTPVESEGVSSPKTTSYEFVKLPEIKQVETQSTEATFYTGNIIWGDFGGKVKMNYLYWTWGGIVKIKAKLDVPAGAFDGLKLIWYSVDDRQTLVNFNPSMNFDKDLTFTLKFKGLDLESVESDNYKFAYLDNEENIVLAEYDQLNVDVDNGVLEVVNAKLNHFSRYGFVRAMETTN